MLMLGKVLVDEAGEILGEWTGKSMRFLVPNLKPEWLPAAEPHAIRISRMRPEGNYT